MPTRAATGLLSSTSRRVAAVILAAAIFLVDAFTPLGIAVAVLYALVLIIAGETASARAIRNYALVCIGLTLFAFVYGHGLRHPGFEAVLRLLFSLAAILATTFLLLARQASDRALRASELRYRTIFETLAVAIWEHDLRPVKAELDGLRAAGVKDLAAYLDNHPEFSARMSRLVRVTDVNGTALRLMGAPSKQAFFTRLDEFLPESGNNFADFLVALDEGRSTYQSEATIRTMSGEMLRVIVGFTFPADGGLDRIQASVLDITERVRVQEALERTRAELEQALRASALGEVSASIAHEINQPLAAITAHAAAAQRWMDRDPPDLEEVRSSLDRAATAAHRASEVVRRVRTLMAKAEPERLPLAFDALVEEAVRLAQGAISGRAVTLTLALDAGGHIVEGDRILLQQVIINLITNAVQAMQANPPEGRLLVLRSFATAEGVAVEVADSGPGFSEEAARRAFDPFFTTKPTGMGLGLAMCRSIMLAHGGDIVLGRSAAHADDEPAGPGGGLVTIRLPVAEASPSATQS